MGKEELLGIVRHALTFVGGIIVTNGLVDQSVMAELSGAVLTIVGIIWSVMNKRK
jgi:hypothetical protein